MPYIQPYVIEQAREMDLLTFLQIYEPTELVQISNGVYSTKTHNSLKISNGKWCWWSRGIGGRSALDYLIKVKDIPFMEAVEIITGRAVVSFSERKQPSFPMPKEKTASNPKNLVLPQVGRCAAGVFNYLLRRGIDKEIVDFCMSTGRIYQSYPYNNAVFVGFDKNNTPRYAALRGIGSDFLGDAAGSDKRYSFSIPAEMRKTEVHLFESAIDLLSYATLQKLNGSDWREFNLLSLSGVYFPKKEIADSALPAALERYLADEPHIEKIVLRLDNDKAGRAAARAITAVLPKKYETADEPPTAGKDYNDMLCIRLGLPIMKCRERSDIER